MFKSNVDGYFKYVRVRDLISERRRAGMKPPYTKNQTLQQYKFTENYRDQDAVSLQWKLDVLEPFLPWQKERAPDFLFHSIMFRIFNWPPTYWLLRDLGYCNWDEARAKRILHKAQQRGDKVFTGAYVVSNNASTRPKIDIYCEALTEARRLVRKLVKRIRARRTIRNATIVLQAIPCVGAFVAYEIASDLRWSPLLGKATDLDTWANPGPGAVRGINRILCGTKQWPRGEPRPDYVAEMRRLLLESREAGRVRPNMRPFEMRDVEHVCCEFDKVMRIQKGEGKARSRYWPPGHPNRKPDWRD